VQQAITLAVLVGCINVALNFAVREGARPSEIVGQLFGSDRAPIVLLIVAFLIGCASLTAMFFFYRLEGSLARGLILMGTVSIVIGSITTMVASGKLADSIEILLLTTLAVLFVFRWLKTVPWFRDWMSGVS
jgi:hypothetical protein